MRDRRLLSAIKYQAAVILKAVTVSLTAAILSGSAFTVPVKAEATGNAGGGFAVTGQSGEAGYISVLYDATTVFRPQTPIVSWVPPTDISGSEDTAGS